MRRLLFYKQGKVVCLILGSILDKKGYPHSPHSWSPGAREAEHIASAQGSMGGGCWGRGSPNDGQRAGAHSPPIQQTSCRAVVLTGRESLGRALVMSGDSVDGHGRGWGGHQETKRSRFGGECNPAPQRCRGRLTAGTHLTTWNRLCMSRSCCH